MVKDGLATTNSDLGTGIYRQPARHPRAARTRWPSTPAPRSAPSSRSSSGRQRPEHRARGGAHAGSRRRRRAGAACSMQGGELFMVNKSAPAKQAAAWEFLKFLDEPENMTTWAIGTGYLPIRTTSADSTEMQDYWAQNPGFKVAYDQLLGGPDTVATAGSVIGRTTRVRARSSATPENSMFLEGTDAEGRARPAAKRRHRRDRRLQHPDRRLTLSTVPDRPCCAGSNDVTRGEHGSMRVAGWKRWAGSALAVVVLADRPRDDGRGPGARRGEQHVVPAGRAEEGERSRSRSTMWHSMNRALGETLQKLDRRVQLVAERREGQPGQPDRLRADVHQVQGGPRHR